MHRLVMWAAACALALPLLAQPAPDTVSPAYGLGGTVSVNGTDFGSSVIDFVWFGPWIDIQPVGTNPDAHPNLDHLYVSHGTNDHVTSARAWSGSKSLDLSVDASTGSWESTLSVKHYAPFHRIYVTWWSYTDPITYDPTCDTTPNTCNVSASNPNGVAIPYTQFKWAALHAELPGGLELQASNNSVIALYAYNHSDDSTRHWYFTPYTFQDCILPPPGLPNIGAGNSAYVWVDASPVGYVDELGTPYSLAGISQGLEDATGYGALPEVWSRVEWFADSGTFDNDDGEMLWAMNREGEQRVVEHHTVNDRLITSQSQNCRTPLEEWERFTIYGLFDQTSGPLAVEEFTHNVDDLYVQWGSRAITELGDAPNYAGCTRLEIQPAIAWADTQTQVILNFGAWTQGRWLWFYITDDDGQVNEIGVPFWYGKNAPTEDPPIFTG